MKITYKNIVEWAKLPECRTKFPELVRRLISETTPEVNFNIPANEAIFLPGFDGNVDSPTETSWVPEGKSYWELSSKSGINRKANEDYEKRTNDLKLGDDRKESTYIFATPRYWKDKEKWKEVKNNEGKWKDVRAYDATNLEEWLDEAIATEWWFGSLLKLRGNGIVSPQEWWEKWSRIDKNLSLTEKFISKRNFNESKRFSEFVENNRGVISVMGDDRDEAVAFAIASLFQNFENKLLDKTIILERDDVELPPVLKSKLIAICDFQMKEKCPIGEKINLKIISTYHKGQKFFEPDIKLSNIPRINFCKGLVEMGKSEQEAEKLTKLSGLSVPILKRLLKNGSPMISKWAIDEDLARKFVPFALCGSLIINKSATEKTQEEGIKDIKKEDIKIIEKISGKCESEIKEIVEKFLYVEEPPIIKQKNLIEDLYVVVSQFDALFSLGYVINEECLEIYFQQVTHILGAKDPVLELSPDEWWKKDILGKSRSYSNNILSGICESLCILAVYGDVICGEKLRIDIPMRVDQIVSNLLKDARSERWLSIRNYLTYLAEASPRSFLESIELDLLKKQPKISTLMRSIASPIGGQNLRLELLRSLEILAWHQKYFERVVEILLKIQKFDSKESRQKTAQDTLNNLYRPWLEATSVLSKERFNILRSKISINRTSIVDVCISLLPKPFAITGTRTSRPEWRMLDSEFSIDIKKEVLTSEIEAKSLLMEIAPEFDSTEFAKLLEVITQLGEEHLERLKSIIADWSNKADDNEKELLCHELRRIRSKLKFAKNLNTKLFYQAIGELESLLTPTSVTLRNKWLFEKPILDWTLYVPEEAKKRPSMNESDEIQQKFRKAAIKEIIQNGGEDSVLAFIEDVNYPGIVAKCMLSGAKIEEYAKWIEKVLSKSVSINSSVFLSGILSQLEEDEHVKIIEMLAKLGIFGEIINRNRFIESLPGNHIGWRIAKRFGRDGEKIYWKKANPVLNTKLQNREREYVVNSLISVGRAGDAFNLVAPDYEQISTKLWIKVLKNMFKQGKFSDFPADYHYLNRIFRLFDNDLRLVEVAELEILFFPIASTFDHLTNGRTLAFHRLMSKDPEFFMDLLKWRYMRQDKAKDQDHKEISENDIRQKAKIAYIILDNWSILPGESENGDFDKRQFKQWVEETYELAEKASRKEALDRHLAIQFAKAAKTRSWKTWLPDVILELLNEVKSVNLREEFFGAIYFERGTIVRGLHEGGVSERKLANIYKELAIRIEKKYPRVSEILFKLVKAYRFEAIIEDDRVELFDRWRFR